MRTAELVAPVVGAAVRRSSRKGAAGSGSRRARRSVISGGSTSGGPMERMGVPTSGAQGATSERVEQAMAGVQQPPCRADVRTAQL